MIQQETIEVNVHVFNWFWSIFAKEIFLV